MIAHNRAPADTAFRRDTVRRAMFPLVFRGDGQPVFNRQFWRPTAFSAQNSAFTLQNRGCFLKCIGFYPVQPLKKTASASAASFFFFMLSF
jgi:hypothetical protein